MGMVMDMDMHMMIDFLRNVWILYIMHDHLYVPILILINLIIVIVMGMLVRKIYWNLVKKCQDNYENNYNTNRI